MTSQVNGYSVNGNFPVPGQNNSSQGFRDNFHAIRTALNRAGFELSELRESAVLKKPISGVASSVNDYAYGKIVRPQLTSYTETFFDNGERSGSVSIDFSRGNFQKIKIFKDIALKVTNVPRGTQVGTVRIWISVQNPEISCSLPESFSYGTRTSFINDNKITFPRRGDYLIAVSSVDNAKKFFIYFLSGLVDFKDAPVAIGASGATGVRGATGSSSAADIDITGLPIASPSEFGIVKVDGTTIGIFDGVIGVIGGIPGATGVTGVSPGAQGATGITGATGAPGPASIGKTGDVYSYMFSGFKSSGNQTPFHIATVSGIGANGTVEMTIAHHHSGGGQHGAYARLAYATNAYTSMVELEKYEKSFDSSPAGNIGFAVTRPITGNLEIHWLGNVSFGLDFNFYMTINSNQSLVINKIGLD